MTAKKQTNKKTFVFKDLPFINEILDAVSEATGVAPSRTLEATLTSSLICPDSYIQGCVHDYFSGEITIHICLDRIFTAILQDQKKQCIENDSLVKLAAHLAEGCSFPLSDDYDGLRLSVMIESLIIGLNHKRIAADYEDQLYMLSLDAARKAFDGNNEWDYHRYASKKNGNNSLLIDSQQEMKDHQPTATESDVLLHLPASNDFNCYWTQSDEQVLQELERLDGYSKRICPKDSTIDLNNISDEEISNNHDVYMQTFRPASVPDLYNLYNCALTSWNNMYDLNDAYAILSELQKLQQVSEDSAERPETKGQLLLALQTASKGWKI